MQLYMDSFAFAFDTILNELATYEKLSMVENFIQKNFNLDSVSQVLSKLNPDNYAGIYTLPLRLIENNGRPPKHMHRNLLTEYRTVKRDEATTIGADSG